MESPVARNRATYDVIAPMFAEQTKNPTTSVTEVATRFAEDLPAGARVADVGCGPGRDTVLLRGLGLAVIGLDLSMGMLRAYGTPGLVQADMRALPLSDGSVDGVWCQAAFLHIPKSDAATVLGEFVRVLRPRGLLYLAVQHGDGEGWEQVDYAPEYRRWFVSYREDELSALLARAGFTVTAAEQESGFKRNWLTLRAIRVD